MSEPVSLQIDKSVIRPIIEMKMAAAISEAMGGHEKMITDILKSWMEQKVDEKGQVSNYSSNKPRYEVLLHGMFEEALKAALTEYMKDKKAVLEKEFVKFFSTKAGTSMLIEALSKGVCESLSRNWMTSIAFKRIAD
jgi:hypothetical protein